MNKKYLIALAVAGVTLAGCAVQEEPVSSSPVVPAAQVVTVASGQDYLDINCPVNAAAKQYRQIFRAYDKDGDGYKGARPSAATAFAASNLVRAYTDAARQTVELVWPVDVQPLMEEQAAQKYVKASIYGEIARQEKWKNVTTALPMDSDLNARIRLLLGLDPAGSDCGVLPVAVQQSQEAPETVVTESGEEIPMEDPATDEHAMPEPEYTSEDPWNQPGPDLNCSDIGHPVEITGPDYHDLDRDGDGWGCDS
jgi:hypothetical protein